MLSTAGGSTHVTEDLQDGNRAAYRRVVTRLAGIDPDVICPGRWAGRVCGLNSGNRAKGHRVVGITADGGFADYVVHHLNALYRMPPHVSREDAVLVTTAGLYGLDVAGGFLPGVSVVVIGSGPVGLMTVQLCKALGAGQVILIGTRAARLNLGLELGADAIVNTREDDPVEPIERLLGRTSADLVIEASGALEAPQQAVEMVRRAGRLLFLAFYPDQVTFDLGLAVQNDVTLYTSRGEGGGNVKRVLSLAAQGKIRGRELVTHHFPLENINEGMLVVRERIGDSIKVVFVP